MNRKSAGILFLSIVLIYIAVELFLSFTPLGDMLSTTALLCVSELILIVPGTVALFHCGTEWKEVLGLKGIRWSLVPLCMLYTWLTLPLVAAVNLASLLFTGNRASEIFSQLSDLPPWLIFFFVGVAAPVFEECMFRGVLYSGLRKGASALQAVLVSALLFGLFHMNINQMLYAFLLGIFFALLRETTGSILPSVICHMTVNGGNALLILSEMDNEQFAEIAKESAQSIDSNMLLNAVSAIIPVAAVGVALALGILIYIAKCQRELPRLEQILSKREEEKGKIWSVPLIAGCMLSAVMILLLLILEHIKLNAA
ncbi:MAG: CPBP family intramembrane metalloprotease [Lachnospiraceae bacterium]|nr:CPBP family intramembrane metalloprotease [Lachnospiraceae bacterium]